MRSFLLGAEREGAFNIPFKVESGGGWTNPYVTDGLLLMWDGIWNAGGGEHDDELRCVDISGNGHDAAFPAGWSLSEGGILKANKSIMWCDRTSGDYDAMSGGYTLEVALTEGTDTNKGGILSVGPNCMVYRYNASYVTGRCSNNYGGVGVDVPQTSLYYARASGTIHHLALAVDVTGSKTMQFIDGVLVATNDGGALGGTTTASLNAFQLSGNGWVKTSTTDGLDGTAIYHCARVYSRVLTADEIAANYAVDKARFNLP